MFYLVMRKRADMVQADFSVSGQYDQIRNAGRLRAKDQTVSKLSCPRQLNMNEALT